MGPRSFNRGNEYFAGQVATEYWRFQWGRGLSTAEITF